MPKVCINCKHYRSREGFRKGQYAGYCDAYVICVDKYDKRHHVIENGNIYSPVSKTSSCNEWKARDAE